MVHHARVCLCSRTAIPDGRAKSVRPEKVQKMWSYLARSEGGKLAVVLCIALMNSSSTTVRLTRLTSDEEDSGINRDMTEEGIETILQASFRREKHSPWIIETSPSSVWGHAIGLCWFGKIPQPFN